MNICLTKSNVMIIDLTVQCVCGFFLFFFKIKAKYKQGIKKLITAIRDNWLLLTFNTDNGVTAFSSCNNYRFPQQQTVPFVVWCVTIIALREKIFKHFIL